MSGVENSDFYCQAKIEKCYENPEEDLLQNGVLIEGLTRQDVSEYITRFPFIYQIYKKNSPHFQQRLIEGLMRAPTPSDCPGFIYGFINEAENGLLEVPFWLKMGRTKHDQPEKRIFQWEKQDNLKLTQVFTVRSQYNIKLQFLVHQLFAYAREPRVINEKNRKQWFYFHQITLTAAAVNILNHIMNTLHTSVKLKAVNYHNKELRQINTKLFFSNSQLDQLIKTLEPTLNISHSISKDLGIQMYRSPEHKRELAQTNNFQQIYEVLSPYSVGRQLQQMLANISKAQQNANTYIRQLKNLKTRILEDLKSIDENTKVKFIKEDIPVNSPQEGKSDKKVVKDEKQEKSNQNHVIKNLAEDSEGQCVQVTRNEYLTNKNIQKYRVIDKNRKNKTKEKREEKVGKSKDKIQETIKQTIKIKPVPLIKKDGKKHRLKMGSMKQIQEYSNKNQIQQIVNICDLFVFDTQTVHIDKIIVIIAKRITFKCPVNFAKGLKRGQISQIRVFCEELESSHLIDFDKQCEKEIFFYLVPDRENILPIDDYHMKNPCIEEVDKVFAGKLRDLCD